MYHSFLKRKVLFVEILGLVTRASLRRMDGGEVVAPNDRWNKSLHYLALFGKYGDTDHILAILWIHHMQYLFGKYGNKANHIRLGKIRPFDVKNRQTIRFWECWANDWQLMPIFSFSKRSSRRILPHHGHESIVRWRGPPPDEWAVVGNWWWAAADQNSLEVWWAEQTHDKSTPPGHMGPDPISRF